MSDKTRDRPSDSSPFGQLDELAQRLEALMPPGVKALREDLHQNIKALLTESFKKMDLVTREEFEVQKAVLARTREKLDSIEAKLKKQDQDADPDDAS